jgi:exopolyphosphatase/guanosine-5'-triphosphate,3'-diphosphate pyrophosphatase
VRKAVLDLGSNSVKYMLADVLPRENPNVLDDVSKTTRLAEGIDKTGLLSAGSMKKTIEIAHEYISRAKVSQAKRILVFATSAVRDARNREEFQSQFKKATDVELVVLTGKQEAALVFGGAVSDPEFPQNDVVVMDVGGGSAEWILGSHGKMIKHHSAPLGCVRMTEHFLQGDPYTQESVEKLMKHLKTELAKIRPYFSLEQRSLIATGGTACTLAAFDCAIDKMPNQVHGRILENERVHTYLQHLCSLTEAEREKLPGIPKSRADIVTAGAAVFAAAMDVLGAEHLHVSVRGLRFGALYV